MLKAPGKGMTITMRDDEPQQPPLSMWIGRNVVILWALILILSQALFFGGWVLGGGDPESSFGGNLLVVVIFGLIVGVQLALGFTVGGLLYLAALARFRTRWSRVRRRLFALAVSPLVAGPLWYWAWTDYEFDHGLPWYMGAVCIAYALTVRFPARPERRTPRAAPEPKHLSSPSARLLGSGLARSGRFAE